MGYRILADTAMAVQFAFLAYVVSGGFAAWRHPRLLWPHLVGPGLARGPVSTERLSAEQFARLERELRRGPGAYGFLDDQRWTLKRVKTLIGRLFHVGTRAAAELPTAVRPPGPSPALAH